MRDHEQVEQVSETDAETEAPKEEKAPAEDLKSGEKVFTIAFFLVGVFFFWQAIQLWIRMDPPRASSAAALPLFTSGIWVVLSFVTILENIRKKTPLSRYKTIKEKLKRGLAYTYPKESFIITLAIVLYCVLLFVGIDFYIVSTVFLYATMCYLSRGNFIKNILWTAIFMGFTFVVFQVIFGVVFS